MTDAELIYNALLRAERKAEAMAGRTLVDLDGTYVPTTATTILRAIAMIREEIGGGLSEEKR